MKAHRGFLNSKTLTHDARVLVLFALFKMPTLVFN
jgi:hypothetical protein